MANTLESPFCSISRASRESLGGESVPPTVPEVPSHKESSLFKDVNINVLDKIGCGSFGTVYHCIYYGRDVAIKEIHSESDSESEILGALVTIKRDFDREASIIAQKNSPHILKFQHFDAENKRLITEYCLNGSLYSFIRDRANSKITLDWTFRLKWMRQVALGMNTVHSGDPSVLHRDLNTSNVFLTEHLDARVGDFGLSKKLKDAVGEVSRCSIEIVCLIWQPPEVIKYKKYSKKSDVYSYGIILHELLTLRFPFDLHSSDNFKDFKIPNHVMDGGDWIIPEDKSLFPGRWHPCLERYIILIKQCCDHDPDQRPDFQQISTQMKSLCEEYQHHVSSEQHTAEQ